MSAVEPDVAVFQPVGILETNEGLADDFKGDTLHGAWICEVTGRKNLMRFHFFEHIDSELNIVVT